MNILFRIVLISIIVLSFPLSSCKPKSENNKPPTTEEWIEAESATESFEPAMDEHNSKNSVDWNGVYKGVLPCADCEGIETQITLLSSGAYLRTLKYLGKESNMTSDKGSFTWDDKGAKVTLVSESGDTQQYLVGENILYHLDQEGNRVEGDLAEKYQLMKNPTDPGLENKKWVLIELMGAKVEYPPESQKAYIELDSETGRLGGSDSCNRMMGSYELHKDGGITLGNIASTMMACPDMTIANQLGPAMGKVKSYSISDDILSLETSDSTSIARFEVGE